MEIVADLACELSHRDTTFRAVWLVGLEILAAKAPNIGTTLRSLFMVKTLGYSGANPFFQYQRKAVVKITCWVDKTDENNVTRSVKYTKLCDVIQVRRIINPSGIYREHGNNKSFTVNLCFRTAEKATSFMPFASEGKWSAEIESGDPGFITLNGMQRVQGRTGEYVKFQVHFIPTRRSTIVQKALNSSLK